jgi:undecaprenyl diphosphate synthase
MPEIDKDRLPEHVAIIMDGNGRWAKKKALNRIRGHEAGTESVRVIVRTSRELGIPYLTLYAFSEENWKRPKYEISALMAILKSFLQSELKEMQDNGIRFQALGDISKLPDEIQKIINKTIKETSGNTKMVLSLALSYGGRQEIVYALKKIAVGMESGEISNHDLDEQLISDNLYTAGMPDPDLLIRTSGEYRVSNFLLWQIAYSEFYITSTLWPDFRKEEYLSAIEEFQQRERRFGATGEQLEK